MRRTNKLFPSLQRKYWLVLAILLIGAGNLLQASHNLAGQITYKKTGTNQYEITLTTYTDPAPQNVDRCFADFKIYDTNGNVIDEIFDVPRVNGPNGPDPQIPSLNCPAPAKMGEYVLGSIKKNVYVFTYTFTGPGNFIIGFDDFARWGSIINMSNPGLTNFHISTLIQNTTVLGANDSPIFLNSPLTFACTGKLWTHNPGGYDAEGDSLAYYLIPNQQGPTNPVGQYQYPSQFGGTFSQDPQTGLITWDVPAQVGAYNVAFVIEEYRNGILIGNAIRDMVIFVEPCNNDPPEIESITDTCIEAGDLLNFNFQVTDPNPGDSLYLYLNNGGFGLNGPFASNITPPAVFTITTPNWNGQFPVRDGPPPLIQGNISWSTTCDHIRNQPYQIDLHAHDNLSYATDNTSSSTMLSADHIIRIWVTAPSVTGLSLNTGPHQVNLNWDKYSCPNAIGYHVYRKIGGAPGSVDSECCDIDPASIGYTRIHSTLNLDDTTYSDNLLNTAINGRVCYLVVAYFAFDQLSCPSEIECVEINSESFRMTNASVVNTAANGEMYVSWSAPDTSIIDQAFFPPPYTYDLFRADGITGTNWTQLNTTPIAFNDTNYSDIGLNTAIRGYNYYVQLSDALTEIVDITPSSSVYLRLFPGDSQLELQWSEYTDWSNQMYYIYRQDTSIGPFVLIDSVIGTGANTHTYLDTGLVNMKEYCYFVRSRGEYVGISGIKNPLINDSEIICDRPRDLTPPCFSPSEVDTASNCIELEIDFFFSQLDSTCAGDLDFFRIWFSDQPGGPYSPLATVPGNATTYTLTDLNSLADCYGVTAVDTFGNESELIEFCFDNCPQFEGSNVFTPNGDGINDWFAPPYNARAVQVSRVQIFDRWGALVFTNDAVSDPNRLWDGMRRNGNPASEGVYYYIIEYNDIRLLGEVERKPLVGNVTLLR